MLDIKHMPFKNAKRLARKLVKRLKNIKPRSNLDVVRLQNLHIKRPQLAEVIDNNFGRAQDYKRSSTLARTANVQSDVVISALERSGHAVCIICNTAIRG